MLALPFMVGLTLGPFSLVHLPLLFAWFCGYCAVYFGLRAFKTRRWRPVMPQLVAYGIPAAVGGLLVAVARPEVLWWLTAVVPILAISAVASRRRAERSLLNDFVLVLLACTMVPLTVSIGLAEGAPLWTRAVLSSTGLVFAYLGGTVLYVKTMIRERGSKPYLVASLTWHLLALAVAALLAPPTVPVFGWFALRAWWFPRLGLRPAKVGMGEIAGTLALFATLWLSF